MTTLVTELAPLGASDFVEQAITNGEQPIVMFALEWCEFCWAIRRFLKAICVPFRSVELDSVAMQADGLGAAIRKVLRIRTGQATIPQIFIGGTHVGGAIDVLAHHDRNDLEPLLREAGIKPTGEMKIVGLSYLPKWLAARPIG